MTIDTKQALVTVGGSSSRLRDAGVEFPLSKSFLELEKYPLFHWCLLGLYHTGIEKLVITSDRKEKLNKAEKVLMDFPYSFLEIQLHQDPGLGSTGLPYQVREHLDDYFFFECGHSMSDPENYSMMDELKKDNNIVLSAFLPNGFVSRPYVKLTPEGFTLIEELTGCEDEFSIGSPCLLNQDYIEDLPLLNFNFRAAIKKYNSEGRLALVHSKMPIEVDVKEELDLAIPIYKSFIKERYASSHQANL